MGRETKTFRQTKRSGSADYSAKNYGRIQRQGSWGKYKYQVSKKQVSKQ